MTRLDAIQDGCWVNLTYPSEDELNTVAATLSVEPSFLRAALDEEETSRIDTEEGQTWRRTMQWFTPPCRWVLS